jgi:hypothetical protein
MSPNNVRFVIIEKHKPENWYYGFAVVVDEEEDEVILILRKDYETDKEFVFSINVWLTDEQKKNLKENVIVKVDINNFLLLVMTPEEQWI